MTDYYRSPGFVIAKNDLREADQLFSFFSRDFGKVEILGRAVRKIKSKLRAGVDLIYFSELEFIQGKAYKTLTDSSVIEKFKNIRSDLNKLEIAHR
ncbi:MAG: DNA repair protein RecO, partial [Candidatus Nealsonbacteria bacterium]|nr:DNA repair protein RecO [Candidatus Nealsonbacteria bacterium]